MAIREEANERQRAQRRVPEDQRARDEEVHEAERQQDLPAQGLNLIVAEARERPPDDELQVAEQAPPSPRRRCRRPRPGARGAPAEASAMSHSLPKGRYQAPKKMVTNTPDSTTTSTNSAIMNMPNCMPEYSRK